MKENQIKINKLHTRWKWDVYGVNLHEVPNFCNCKCKIRQFEDEIRLKWRLSVVSEYDVQIGNRQFRHRRGALEHPDDDDSSPRICINEYSVSK